MSIKRLMYLFFILLFCFLFNIDIGATVYIPGNYNGWSIDTTSELYNTNSPSGFVKRIIQPVDGSYFKIVKNNWGDPTNWSAGYWIDSFDQTWNIPSNDQGDNNNGKFTNYPFVNPYMTVTSPSSPSSGVTTRFGFMLTANYPIKITSVTDDSSGNVPVMQKVRVRIQLNGSKSPQEKVYIRYTADSWVSDSFVLSSASNTTIYTCHIPAQDRFVTVEYYVLTTTTNWSFGNDLDNYPDLMTINLNNNGGANYSYSVTGIRTIDASDTDWTGIPGSVTNSAVVSSNEWIWVDGLNDTRDGDTYRDLTEIRAIADHGYLYFLFKFQAFNDAADDSHFIEIMMDNINKGKETIIGRGVGGADTDVSTNARWDYVLKILSGSQDFSHIINTNYSFVTNGYYAENIGNRIIEAALPLNFMGGLSEFTNNTVRFSFAFLKNDTGNVGAWSGDTTSDVLDVLSGLPNTWKEVEDKIIHFFVDLRFDSIGNIVTNNNGPSQPVPISPTNMRVSSFSPAFTWQSATDSDADNINIYHFQLSLSNTFTNCVEEQMVHSTNYTITASLSEDTVYYWRVLAYDEHGRKGSFSAVASFTSPRPKRIIDGDPSDWTNAVGNITNSAVVAGDTWIWKDASDDVRRGQSCVGGSNSYELTEFRITSDTNYIFFLIKFNDIDPSSYPYIALAIDTNKVSASAQEWFGDLSDTKVNTNAFWERELIFPYQNMRYYRPDWTSVTNGTKLRSDSNDCIEARISWSALDITNGGSYRFALMVAQDSNGYTMERYGSDALDCISPMPGETWNEIDESSSFGRVDFFFDIDFDSNGGVNPNNNAPGQAALLSPVNVKVSSYNPQFQWDVPTDIDGDNVYAYIFQMSENSNFSTFFAHKAVYRTNYTVSSAIQDNKIYYWRVKAYDEHGRAGSWSSVSSFTSPESFKTIDGDDNDWHGSASTQPNIAVISSNEWIWTDKTGDRRDDYDSGNLGNYDNTETRVTFDSNHIYLLFKYQGINDITKPYIAFSIDVDQNGGDTDMTWMADDSGILIGSNYGRANVNSHYGEYNVIIHDVGIGTTKIELYTNAGSAWYAPPTDGPDTCYVDPTDNLIEVKIARQDLGLDGTKTARMHFAFCYNIAAWANGNDTTYTYGTCDAVDTISITRFLTNDKYNDRSAWVEEISDGDIDFWVELRIGPTGIISNMIPSSVSVPSPTNNTTNVSLLPTLSWTKVTDLDDQITSYLLELSSTTNLDSTVLLRVNVTNTNYSCTEALPDGLTYYWRVRARDRRGVLSTNAQRWSFTTIETQQIPNAVTAPFTPYIDGIKDIEWGNSNYLSSPQSNLPANYAKDIYICNDANYLYLGWTMYGDPWEDSGEEKSAHYGFVFDSKHDPFGGEDDPFQVAENRSADQRTKISWTMKPDLWLEGWIQTGYDSFGQLVKYIWNESSIDWVDTVLEDGKDYAMVTNSWAEIRIPLNDLDVEVYNKVNMIWYFRPSDDKSGVSDSVPYDNSCNDYADNASTLTTKVPYRIQYAVIDTWHYPDKEEVMGLGKMRNPVSPSSSEKAVITIGVYPYDGYDSAIVYYSTNNWTSTNTAVFEEYQKSANNVYLKTEIGPFNNSTVIRYFTSVTRNGMTTYNFGSGQISTVTSNRTTARANAYQFMINNSAPLIPVVEISPRYVFTNDQIIANVTYATDVDGDSLVSYFEWYRNGIWQSNLSYIDSSAPFQSKISNFKTGENWYTIVRLFDGNQFSPAQQSPVVGVLLRKWLEDLNIMTNSSKFTNNEFIWYDKEGDVRDDVTVNNQTTYDLIEFHAETDAEYIYFLFRFNQIIDAFRVGIAMAVDTNQNAGTSVIGDEMNLTLGSNYSGTMAEHMANINLLFHSFMIGTTGVEMKKDSDTLWTQLHSTNALFTIYKSAGFAEARIKRDLLNLLGNKTARLSLVIYEDYVGLANEVDSSVSYSGNDGLDILGVGLCRGTNIINYADQITSYEEELSDNQLDFWFDLRLNSDNILTNSSPSIVSGLTPTNNAILNDLTPTIIWSNNTDTDVVAYLLELGLFTNKFLYRVNVKSNSFTIPENLIYGYTNYYWRVYARDKAGILSSYASNRVFRIAISSPFAGKVMDNMNRDNYAQINGLVDADGDVVFNWAPTIDPSGILNYYICIGTSAGGTEVTNDKVLSGNRTVYTAFNLPKGEFYYAKIKARNNIGVTGDYGPDSDGIYVAKVTIDSNTSDWADKSCASNSTVITNGIGIWKDVSLDVRNAVTNLDLEQFKVALDYYNLYLYFRFSSLKSWADGSHYIQVAVDNDFYSDTRSFLGRNIENADLFVTSVASWEYLVKILSGSGFDTCYACDTTYGNWQRGVYKDNAADRTIECAIPLDKIGGNSKFLNSTINLSVAVFQNNSGNIQAIDGDSSPDALDVICSNTSSDPTWDAISDRVLDYYLECSISTNGNITVFTGRGVPYTEPPSYPTVGAGSAASWVQNAIIYFLFVDRFYNGDAGNDITGDTTRKGGDFKGIVDNMDYIRDLNVNCIYMAPPMKHGGAAGYDPYDWWNVDDHFGGNSEFRDLIKELKKNSIDLIIDWPGTAIGGGETKDNNPNWASYYNSPWGGWPEWTVGMAEVQQFFVDTLVHWSAKGVRGYRMDYAKFDGNPVDHGHQYWQYVRARLKAKFPDRYMFGEIFDSAYKISTYTWAGNELDGCFDFPLEEYGSGGVIKWAIQQSIDSGTFWGEIQNTENTYGDKPLMISFIDNHDKDRGLHRAGGDSWKMRIGLGFTLTWHEPTSIFYGTEMGMDGWRIGDDLDNSPCIDMMWGINSDVTPWWGGYNFTQHNFIKRLIAGKRSFPGLRSGKNAGGVNVRYASGQWFIYERNYYNDAVLVILNRSSSGANIPRNDFTTWSSRTWRDWMNSSDYYNTGSDGKFTGDVYLNGNDTRILVSREFGSGGYGECTISGTVNVPNAIVKVKDYNGTIYSRVDRADGNGQYSLNNVVCKDSGNEDRSVRAWAPGYQIQYQTVSVYDTGNIIQNFTLIVDSTPPDIPKGLSCRAGDEITELTWSKNTEEDFSSYLIYRSDSLNGSYSKIDEVLEHAFIDKDLENNKAYYYKIRAKDVNGNVSGFSVPVYTTVGPVMVTFWLNLNNSGYNNIQQVLIQGNTEKMNFWGNFGDDPEMEDVGDGWWKISFEFDARMGIMYKYKLLENGNWHEEGNFSGTGSWYGNRYIDFYDEGDKQLNIFNIWNSLGDAAPRPVQNLSTSPGNQQITLSWDKNKETDIQYYSIYRATPLRTGPYSKLTDVNALYNTYIDRDVSNGVDYHYYITATDGNDNQGSSSQTNTVQPQAQDSTPPSKPVGLSVYAYSTNQVQLIWNPNNEGDIAGYNVYRSNSGSWAQINDIYVAVQTNPNYIDAISAGAKYYYRVTAVDDSTNANESTNSSSVSAQLMRVFFKVDIGNIAVSSVKIGGNKLPFNWTGLGMIKESDYIWSIKLGILMNDSLQYKYQYDGTFEGDFDTWHKNRDLNMIQTNYSELELFDDWESQPDVPQNVWAFPLDEKVQIHWDKVTTSEDIKGYNVYYTTNATSKFVNKVNETVITDSEFVVSGLNNSMTYYFVVRSIDSGAIELESYDSEIVSATPVKSVPVYFRTSVDDLDDTYAFIFNKGGFILKIE